MTIPLPPRPERRKDDLDPPPPRSIDDFFEEAYASSPKSCRLRYWLVLVAMGIANCGDATEVTCIGYILAYPDFQNDILKNDFANRGATLASSIFAGMLIGGIVTGAFGDKLGRKPSLLLGMIMNSIAGALSAFSPTVSALCLCRFFSGLGVGAVLSSLIALATELCPPSRRGFYVAFVASFWTLGSIAVATLALVLLGTYQLSWRVFVLCCAAPSAVGSGLVSCLVPESPRFLALHGRYGEAAGSANRIADGMGYRGARLGVDEVEHHFSQKGSKIEKPETAVDEKAMLDKRGVIRESTLYAAKNIRDLYTRGVRGKTIPLQLLWFSLAFGSGLCTWIVTIFTKVDLNNVYFHALAFALANIPGNVASGVLIDRVGRKLVLMGSMVIASIALVPFAMTVSDGGGDDVVLGGASAPAPASRHSTAWIVASACVFHAALVSSWSTISVMTGELFPTKLRGTGMGMCSACGRVAAMIVQFINGALVNQLSLLLGLSSGMIMLGALIPLLPGVDDMSHQNLSDTVSAASRDGKALVADVVSTTDAKDVHVGTTVELV